MSWQHPMVFMSFVCFFFSVLLLLPLLLLIPLGTQPFSIKYDITKCSLWLKGVSLCYLLFPLWPHWSVFVSSFASWHNDISQTHLEHSNPTYEISHLPQRALTPFSREISILQFSILRAYQSLLHCHTSTPFQWTKLGNICFL